MLQPPFYFPEVLAAMFVLGIYFLGDNGLAFNQNLFSIIFQ